MVKFVQNVSTGKIKKTMVKPYYGYLPINAKSLKKGSEPFHKSLEPIVEETQARSKTGTDFSNVYFPSRMLFKRDVLYNDSGFSSNIGTLTSPPLQVLFYSLFTQYFDFSTSLFIHIFIQIFIFIIFCFLVHREYKSKDIDLLAWSVTLSLTALLFTEVGLAWFERGQHSLYAASGLISLLLGFKTKKLQYFFFAAILASMKWASFPLLFLIWPYLLFLFPKKDLFQRLVSFLPAWIIFVAGILISAFIMPSHFQDYINIILSFEANLLPVGISLGTKVPLWLSKLFPFLHLLASLILYRLFTDQFGKWRKAFIINAIFSVGMICTMFGTICFHYRVLIMLGFLPFLFYLKDEFDSAEQRSMLIFNGSLGLLFLFRILAFETAGIVYSYLIVSMYILISPFLWRKFFKSLNIT